MRILIEFEVTGCKSQDEAKESGKEWVRNNNITVKYGECELTPTGDVFDFQPVGDTIWKKYYDDYYKEY